MSVGLGLSEQVCVYVCGECISVWVCIIIGLFYRYTYLRRGRQGCMHMDVG